MDLLGQNTGQEVPVVHAVDLSLNGEPLGHNIKPTREKVMGRPNEARSRGGPDYKDSVSWPDEDDTVMVEVSKATECFLDDYCMQSLYIIFQQDAASK